MILYIIKSILCSALCIVAYHIFLEKDKVYIFNRFYLLASLILCLIIPTISITLTTESQFVENLLPLTVSAETGTSSGNVEAETQGINPQLLLAGYVFVVVVLLVRFVRHLFSAFKAIRTEPVALSEGSKLIISPSLTTPHTFLKFIFINERDSRNYQILTHELTHARQWHSLDILFIELIHCIFWFNPLLILFKKAIKLNHEFLADDSVIKTHQNVSRYQKLLLEKIADSRGNVLASSFNYSITKKRFTMMTSTQNNRRSVIRIVTAIIFLLAASVLFVNKIYAQTPPHDEYTIYKNGQWQNQKLTINPEPIGGIGTLLKAIQKQIRYPAISKKEGNEGDVLVMFEVDETGKAINFSIVKTLDKDCDNEGIRSLKESGIKWRAAELDGKRYASRFVIPVSFRLEPSKVKNLYDLTTVLARPVPQIVVSGYRQVR